MLIINAMKPITMSRIPTAPKGSEVCTKGMMKIRPNFEPPLEILKIISARPPARKRMDISIDKIRPFFSWIWVPPTESMSFGFKTFSYYLAEF